MPSDNTVHFRKARSNDIAFMSAILIDAASASGVHISMSTLADHPDAYQYIEGFPNGTDVGVIAETNEGQPVGAAWVRLLATDAHAIDKQLPELTMGIIAEYRRRGVGKRLMEELYNAALARGISEISLGVHSDNIPAINLYTKQNWIKDGTFEEYVMMSRKIEG